MNAGKIKMSHKIQTKKKRTFELILIADESLSVFMAAFIFIVFMTVNCKRYFLKQF